MLQLKDFLGEEQARNKRHAALYETLVKRAFGANIDVIIGHHIGFEIHGDIQSETEIPSADTLLFNREIMAAVFGEVHASRILEQLSRAAPDEREKIVAEWLDLGEAMIAVGTRSTHLTEVA